jgi:hypothetical protein
VSIFRKYTRLELVRFVRAMDAVIDEPTDLLVIGGAAATLKYGAQGTTKDIDTWNNVPAAVLKAAEQARTATGLLVPIEKAAVADGPYHYEDRIRSVSMKLKRLRIFVPERHDLVLMKVVRGNRHDDDVITEIHARHPLKLETLVERFETEMCHVMKDEKILRLQFRVLVEVLFGLEAGKGVATSRKPGAGGIRV